MLHRQNVLFPEIVCILLFKITSYDVNYIAFDCGWNVVMEVKYDDMAWTKLGY